MSVLTEQRLTELMLQYVWAVYSDPKGDRRGGASPVDPATGIPLDPSSLVERYRAVRGEELVMSIVMEARQFASGLLRREVKEDDGEVRQVALVSIPEAEWSEQEAELVRALTWQVRVWVADHPAWCLTSLQGYFDDTPLRPDEGGLPSAWRWKYEVVREVKKTIQGTPLEQVPRSIREDLPGKVWEQAPQWAQREAVGDATV